MKDEIDLSWFSLANYDAVEDFDIYDWCCNLSRRQSILLRCNKEWITKSKLSIERQKMVADIVKEHTAQILAEY